MAELTKVSTLPMKHQVGKLVIGTIVGFAATQLSNKAYDAILDCVKNKKLVTIVTQ